MTVDNDYEFTPEEKADLENYGAERDARLRRTVIVTLTTLVVLVVAVNLFT